MFFLIVADLMVANKTRGKIWFNRNLFTQKMVTEHKHLLKSSFHVLLGNHCCTEINISNVTKTSQTISIRKPNVNKCFVVIHITEISQVEELFFLIKNYTLSKSCQKTCSLCFSLITINGKDVT